MPIFAMCFPASCGQPSDPTPTASTGSVTSTSQPTSIATAIPTPNQQLPARLDCLRQSGGVLLIGHRGGPTRDYPENALETLQRTFNAGTRAMEIDIAETKDSQLVLMHDDDLDRTSTGTGLVADHTLAEIQQLNLEAGSKTMDFHPPTLQAALDWAVKTGAILELDKKRSAAFQPIIAAVRAAKAENNVLMITYTDDQAIAVHKLAPDIVITATIDDVAQLDRLLAGGVRSETLLAWTGNIEPRPDLWKALASREIESVFGTNGSKAGSLDTRYWEDDDGSEFSDLVADGLPILVTGLTDKTSRQLAAPRQKSSACGI